MARINHVCPPNFAVVLKYKLANNKKAIVARLTKVVELGDNVVKPRDAVVGKNKLANNKKAIVARMTNSVELGDNVVKIGTSTLDAAVKKIIQMDIVTGTILH